MDKHIFLWGFMGVGKTSFGSRLANKLERPFLDLDDIITAAEGKSINSLFSEIGEEAFRFLETNYLAQTILMPEKTVIACGGGTPCFNNNAIKMLDNGPVIHVTCAKSILAERLLLNKDKRPIVSHMQNLNEMLARVDELLSPRAIYYNLAHFEFDNTFPMHNKEELDHLQGLLNNHFLRF